MKFIIKNLLDKTSGNAIIILQSDHGYGGFAFENTKNIFKNLSAFYFPDQNYSALYDSITNVNTFRIILNKYFNQKMPLLPDSCIELKD